MAATSIHPIRTTEIKSIQYVMRKDKTNNGSLVTTYACGPTPEEIEKAFSEQRSFMNDKGSVLSYHIIQSFAPDEANIEQVMQAGQMLCDRLLKGHYQFVLATHNDTEHLHNHIIFCKANMDNNRSFGTLSDTKKNPAWKTIRALSDEICKELGLSVIENADIGKGVSRYEWERKQQGKSWKAKLKDELDFIIRRSDTFEDFLEKCQLNNIEAVYQPDKKVNLKFRISGQQKFTRASTLGYYYTLESIQKRIRNYTYHRSNIINTNKFEAKGLQCWADIQNMKNVADMINMLEGYNIKSTEELKPKANVIMAERASLSSTLDDMRKKINDISDRIELVRTFKRTKPFHDEYKTLSPRKKKKFAEENAPPLERFHSAGATLHSLYPDGRFPSVAKLEKQREQLETEGRSLYQQYLELKKMSTDIDKASQTIEDYIESLRDNPDVKRKKGELE